MQRFDQWLDPDLFGLTSDAGPQYPGGVTVHQSCGTTGASYSPEVGNPNGYFYTGTLSNPSDQNVAVLAQGAVLSMPPQNQPGGRLSAYDALASMGRAMTPTSQGSRG